MSIEELKLMLSDVFELDMWFPGYSIRNQEFEKASYSIWAVKELIEYITQKIYPRKEAPINELILLTSAFESKISQYAQIRPENNLMFMVARDILSNVLEVLRAAK